MSARSGRTAKWWARLRVAIAQKEHTIPADGRTIDAFLGEVKGVDGGPKPDHAELIETLRIMGFDVGGSPECVFPRHRK